MLVISLVTTLQIILAIIKLVHQHNSILLPSYSCCSLRLYGPTFIPGTIIYFMIFFSRRKCSIKLMYMSHSCFNFANEINDSLVKNIIEKSFMAIWQRAWKTSLSKHKISTVMIMNPAWEFKRFKIPSNQYFPISDSREQPRI